MYEVQGQYSISYDGIRAFAAWLARHGIIVQTTSSDITTSGDPEKTFHAKVRVKEATTGVVFEGISSQPQYGLKKDDTKYYDSTAETKAHSKAERNAIRKHIPPDLISKFIEETKKDGKIKTLNVSPKDTPRDTPRDTTKDPKYCTCEKPIPNSINGQTCQTCKKPLEVKQ